MRGAHFCLDGASQSEAACLELNGEREEWMNEPGDLEEESSSSRQQAQALAGIILVKGNECVCGVKENGCATMSQYC